VSFLQELKRRNVFRVGIAYGVATWLLIQVSDTVFPRIGLPDSAVTLVIALLAIGFIPALIFAWAFEVTPEGVKREKDVDRGQSIVNVTARRLDRSITIVLALALGYFMWDKFSSGSDEVNQSVQEETLEKSIAVLPFVNMSSDQENEYFSDGLSEELLNLLAKVDGLKVAARTSSFKFKNKDVDIAEVGEKLNVATVLEGSVRKSGNTARITAQLIKVDDGFHLWSETYDRDLDNIFEVQDEIAQAIVEALALPLLGQDQNTIASSKAANFEAYDLYLLGVHMMRSVNDENLEKAADYFSRAVAIDPSYSPAWSTLAATYMLWADFGSLPFDEGMALAEQALNNADPKAAGTIASQGMLHRYRGKLLQAANSFEQVVAMEPNWPHALMGLSDTIAQSDPERSLELAQRAWELDPLSERARNSLINKLANLRQFEGAESLIRKFLLDDPDNPGLYENWAHLYRNQGLIHLAIPKMVMAHNLRPGDSYPAFQLVNLYLRLDDVESAQKWADIAHSRGPETRWTKIGYRTLNSYLGNFDDFLALMEDEIESGVISLSARVYYGTVLAQLGRPDDAIEQYRYVLEEADDGSEGISIRLQADAITELATLLPEGEEKETWLAKLRPWAADLLEQAPDDFNSHLYQAYLAAIEGDRELMIFGLRKAFELGYRGRWFTEVDPIFKAWKNDPEFIALMLEWREDSAWMKQQLEANLEEPAL
jgi:TolB-like protein